MKLYHRSVLQCLMEAQDGVCAYCPHPLAPLRTVRDQTNPMRPTVDHVWPISEDHGLDRPGNYLAVHARCNHAKDSLPPTAEQLATLDQVNRRLRWVTPRPPLNPMGLTSAEEALALLAARSAA